MMSHRFLCNHSGTIISGVYSWLNWSHWFMNIVPVILFSDILLLATCTQPHERQVCCVISVVVEPVHMWSPEPMANACKLCLYAQVAKLSTVPLLSCLQMFAWFHLSWPRMLVCIMGRFWKKLLTLVALYVLNNYSQKVNLTSVHQQVILSSAEKRVTGIQRNVQNIFCLFVNCMTEVSATC